MCGVYGIGSEIEAIMLKTALCCPPTMPVFWKNLEWWGVRELFG